MKWLISRPSYYYYKNKWTKLLLEKATVEGNKYFPWCYSSINSEVMERDYIRYILDHDQELNLLGGNKHFSAISEMYRECLQKGFLSNDKIIEIQNIFYSFQRENEFSHAFIIGSYAHWVLIVLHKYNDNNDDNNNLNNSNNNNNNKNNKLNNKNNKNNKNNNLNGEISGKIEGLFIDSYNQSILSISMDKIKEKIIENLIKRKIPEKEIPIKLEKQLKMVESIQYCISLSFDCANGTKNFIEENIFLQVDFILNDFFNYINKNKNNNDNNLNNNNNNDDNQMIIEINDNNIDINNNNNNNDDNINNEINNQQIKKRKINEEEIKEELKEDFNEKDIEKIEEWFKNDYHPAILLEIFENLIDLKKEIKEVNLRVSKIDRLERLNIWRSKLCSLAKLKNNKVNSPLLRRFSRSVSPKIRILLNH